VPGDATRPPVGTGVLSQIPAIGASSWARLPFPLPFPRPQRPLFSFPVPGEGCDLLELLAGVPDGRTGQGRDHPVAAVLALAAAAVVAGMKGYTAISGWVADGPPPVLAGLYLRCGAAPDVPPSKTTIWRVMTDAGTEELDAAAGTGAGQAGRQGRQGRQEP
jgi:DDE_Tnp_1-associated